MLPNLKEYTPVAITINSAEPLKTELSDNLLRILNFVFKGTYFNLTADEINQALVSGNLTLAEVNRLLEEYDYAADFNFRVSRALVDHFLGFATEKKEITAVVKSQ